MERGVLIAHCSLLYNCICNLIRFYVWWINKTRTKKRNKYSPKNQNFKLSRNEKVIAEFYVQDFYKLVLLLQITRCVFCLHYAVQLSCFEIFPERKIISFVTNYEVKLGLFSMQHCGKDVFTPLGKKGLTLNL